MKSFFRIAGYLACGVLIVGGLVTMFVGFNGRSDVQDNLKNEKIQGTPDMTQATIKADAAKAGLKDVTLPDCDVAGEEVDNGSAARCFADYMRVHALEATGGKTYAEMPRFATDDGKGTNDAEAASKDPESGAPLSNPEREIWVTEVALAQALNTAYFAESVATFAIWMGAALFLIGIGLLVSLLGLASRSDQ